VIARADDHLRQRGRRRHLGDGKVRIDGHAAAGLDRAAIEGNQMPIEKPPSGILIGHPQSLGDQDQGIDREFGNQQEADFLGGVVRQVAHG
jgi:hypothetical protein